MEDHFKSAISSKLSSYVEKQIIALRFGVKEQQVLRLFYDERLKVRRDKVPVFHIYAKLCDGKPDGEWFTIMIDADKALHNLTDLLFIKKIEASSSAQVLRTSVGAAATQYEVTVKGLEILQSWHPPIALRLRGWIAVLPPWLVLVSTVAGGIASAWKIVEQVDKWVR